MLQKGLQFKRYFTKDQTNVYDMFEYERRNSLIKDQSGRLIYEVKGVEVPKHYSQIATDIVAQKYLRKAGVPQKDGSLGAETSIKQLVHRLANCWKVWGIRNNYFMTDKDATVFYDEIVYSILSQSCAPNSPQWFNTGLYESYGINGKPQGHYFVNQHGKTQKSTSAYERPQPHACFILSVDDDLINKGGIMDLWVREARIFKYGSGVGTNFSSIRSKGEELSGGGTSSGLMSFLKIGDRAAGAIKSGGTTRRAAKMVCLDINHPEVVDFINWKKEEEEKAKVLINAGYPGDYEGEAYSTISGQNSNNSVRVNKAFFDALDQGKQWGLKSVGTGKVIRELPAQSIWDDIVSSAWRCADPGLQFDTTINEWHTCPQGGKIRASNPCSEYMFLDNTACNLASINLMKYLDFKTLKFDVEAFEHTARLWTVVLELSVLMAQFPSEEVAQLSYKYRTLGLGYANLGSLLMTLGIPYDSEEARAIAGAITSVMTGVAYRTSAEMASFLGAFEEYDNNKQDMLRVMKNHLAATYDAQNAYVGLSIKPQGIKSTYCPDYLLKKAGEVWNNVITEGEKYGYRNAQTTVIAPTGTIGLVMDCDTTGIEPDLALVKYKKLSGGGYFKIVNQSVPLALKNLKYDNQQIKHIVAYIGGKNTLQGCPHLDETMLLDKGFTEEDIVNIRKNIPTAFDIQFVFNQFSISEATLKKFNVTQEQLDSSNFNMLSGVFGISKSDIEKINQYVYGASMIEGAPYLKEEHLAVFDTANKCGTKGKRYIHASGHLKMMASTQPFLSGAISKTINLPNEASLEAISDCYRMGWNLGLKAVAVYRDGSKYSQPLSSSKDNTEEFEEIEKITSKEEILSLLDTSNIINELSKRISHKENIGELKNQLTKVLKDNKLPLKRRGFTYKAKIDGHAIYLRTGEYEDGSLGEIFIDLAKEGSTLRSLMNCFAIATSVGLQHGVPLEDYVEKFIFTKFDPSGSVDHPNIKVATSIVDFVFRLLAYEYLGRTDLVHVQDHELIQTQDNVMQITPGDTVDKLNFEKKRKDEKSINPIYQRKEMLLNRSSNAKEITKIKTTMLEISRVSEHNKSMQSDAPGCNVCGHITVRSGTCYKCLNCGNSLGCS